MNNKKVSTSNIVYLALGTNLGNKQENMEVAITKIEKQIGKIVSQSAFYNSEPFGFESDNSFLNAVVEVQTDLSPENLLTTTQQIEKEMGRTIKTGAKGGYSDREIDIDILFYNKQVINDYPKLSVPHSQMHKRDFVLKPLTEIAPDFIHPVLNKTVGMLLEDLKK